MLDGADIELPRRKVLALFAYLTVAGGRQSRGKLTALLYPETAPTRASSNFRHTLSILRSTIGADWLEVDRKSVSIRFGDRFRVDVREFRSLVEASRPLDPERTGVADVQALTRAAELYRGDFLSGFYLKECTSFEEWEHSERQYLIREYEFVLEHLTESYGACQEYKLAIDYGNRWLMLDTLNERAHRHLIRLYSLAGQFPASLKQYEDCRFVLEKALGEKPTEETEKLHQEIRAKRHKLSIQAERARERPAPPSPTLAQSLEIRRHHNLQIQPTPFVGRTAELRSTLDTLMRESVRILTLTGSGGTGKTRIAIQAATESIDRFEHGVFFVDLSVLNDATQVLKAISAALNIPEIDGESRPLLEVLVDYLVDKEMLLVLDNFEHLLTAAQQVAQIVTACPHTRVLVTSREPLRLRGEIELVVPPMGLPAHNEPPDRIEASDAVRLFCERARAVRPDFYLSNENAQTVAEICHKLDGLPLSIELAAAHVKVLELPVLLDQLTHRLKVLKDGPRDLPTRQRSLRSELDWSFELLSDTEKCLFRRFSVFPAGCTLEALDAVCDPSEDGQGIDAVDELSSLTNKSLIRRHESAANPGFQMLPTIREYAAEKLRESGEHLKTAERFAQYMLDLIERNEGGFYGPNQGRIFELIDGEYDNIRGALVWMFGNKKSTEGVRLAGALGFYWQRRGRHSEGYDWLGRFLELSDDSDAAAPRAKAFYHFGWIRRLTCGVPFTCFDSDEMTKESFTRSYELWKQTGNQHGVALSLSCMGWAYVERNPKDQMGYFGQSIHIARQTGDAWTIAFCLIMAYAMRPRKDKSGNFKQAALEEAIALSRHTGDPHLLGQSTKGYGDVLMFLEQHDAAETWYLKSLHIARENNDRGSILAALLLLSHGYIALARLDSAYRCISEGLRLAADSGPRSVVSGLVSDSGKVAKRRGQPVRALHLWGAASAIAHPEGAQFDPKVVQYLGLETKTVAAEWAVGRAMSWREAVQYALGSSSPTPES
jgi:predicted ATPase/DNA-binding SARP family transcriptional activator